MCNRFRQLVLQFPVMFLWSRIFMSWYLVLHFQVLHFQSTRDVMWRPRLRSVHTTRVHPCTPPRGRVGVTWWSLRSVIGRQRRAGQSATRSRELRRADCRGRRVPTSDCPHALQLSATCSQSHPAPRWSQPVYYISEIYSAPITKCKIHHCLQWNTRAQRVYSTVDSNNSWPL